MACGVKPVWLNARVSVVCAFISEKAGVRFLQKDALQFAIE
tara:strand:+ start:1582 stop:1704 length:123 start_codon:yes stop_codon:yes gene_type:complete